MRFSRRRGVEIFVGEISFSYGGEHTTDLGGGVTELSLTGVTIRGDAASVQEFVDALYDKLTFEREQEERDEDRPRDDQESSAPGG